MKSKRKPCYASKGLPKVPGKPKGTDIIPAWLTPGEAVLSPGAAEMLGRGNVQALNKAASTMRLGTPQYKAEGEDEMQPDYAMMGNQRAAEILSNSNLFNGREVQAANRYMDPAGLAGGPSLARDQAFLGGTRSLESVNNPADEALRKQIAQAQQGLFGGNRPMRLGSAGDDGTSEGLDAAQEAVGSALSYGRQAAQDAIEQGQQARYMSQGGMVQPGYYALGTAYAGAQDVIDQQLRAQANAAESMRQGFAPTNATPNFSADRAGNVSQMLKSAISGGNPGPFNPQLEGVGYDYASRSGTVVPKEMRLGYDGAPTAARGMAGASGNPNIMNYRPDIDTSSVRSGAATVPSASSAGYRPQVPATPVDPMAAKMGQYSATPARLTDPIAQKMASAAYTPPAAQPPAPGLASRLGTGLMQNLNTIPAVAQTVGDIAGVMRSDANPAIKGLASAESVGNAAFGALADRVGGGRLAGAGMVPMAASGYRPITAGLNAVGVQTPLSYIQNPERQGGLNPRTPSSPMSAEQTQRFLDNPNRNANILGSRGATAEQRQSAPTVQQQPTPAKVGTGDNAQAYYQEGMIQDGGSSRLTPSQAQMDFVSSGRPASSLSKDELYKIYPSARDAAAKDAFDASQRASYQKQGLAVPWDLQTPEQRVQTQGRESAMAQRQAQNASAIGNQMAGLNMSAQRQAQSFMNNALTILNNPGGYTDNQLWAAKTMLDRLAPVAQTGVSTSSQFYNTDANRGLTAAQANQANSAARLNYSNANLNDEKVRQERMGPAPTRVGSGSAMKIDEAITGYDTMGNPQKSSVIFNPQDGTYRPLLSQQEQMMVNQRKAQYPNEDEAAIVAFILSKRQQQLPMK